MAMSDTRNPQKIIWMMDETIAQTRPSDWTKAVRLERELVSTIGHKGIEHEVLDPLPCLAETARQLNSQEFSSVIDLTGWLSPAMRELFPQTPIEDSFSLSRVRVVSSPCLETTGYRVSLSPKEITQRKNDLDLRKPLIMDDVSFTGWTARKTMDLWGINPQNATHAFLIANTGNLGDAQGAVPMLESLGSEVVYGYEMQTPRDDGWHLKDLHQHPRLREAFILSLFLQKEMMENGSQSNTVKRFLGNKEISENLFPNSFTSEDIRKLMQEGKFILRNSHMINGGETHASNPFLWASPYFQQHVDMNTLFAQRDGIMKTLQQLQSLTADPEGKYEASLHLQKEVRKKDPEMTQSMRGKERW